MSYILAIDQGTSSTKTILFDAQGKARFKATEPLKTHYLEGNRVEQDPEVIYENVLTSVKKCLDGFQSGGGNIGLIKACGISNQRETFVLWDKSGKPLYNAVVWQCKRSVEVCDRLKSQGLESRVNQKTGLIIDPYFSGTKVIWLYENEPRIKAAIDQGAAYFGNVDSWLLYKMTGGKSYSTDYTNASRTLFFNLKELQWDRELLADFGLSNLNLPELKPSSYHFGETDLEGLLPHAIPISAMIGDSHAAAFGEGCFEPGNAKATLGTGSSILMNIGSEPKTSQNGMVTTICWSTADRIDYALEGIIVSAGATIEWVKNQLGLFENTGDLEKICLSLEDNGGVYIVPAFSGLGAPHWDMNRKAGIEGLSFDSTKNHVIRAAVESVPYQIKDVIVAMEADSGTPLTALKIDGGITSNQFVVQFLADLLDRPITNIKIADVSALGAGYLAGLNACVYQSIDQLKTFNQDATSTLAGADAAKVKKQYEGWKKVIGRIFGLLLFMVIISCAKNEPNPSTPVLALKAEELTTDKSLVNTTKSSFAKLQAPGLDEVTLTNGFWAERLHTCTQVMVSKMWAIYSDAEISHALRNFEIAAGLVAGNHRGAPFHDGDFYKLIEAAGMAFAVTKDEKFNQMIDEVIPLIRASQRKDGYIHTPVMIDARNHPEKAGEFRDRLDFETYNMGHLMTAACVHYKATGKTDLLVLAKKAADYLYDYCQKYPEKLAGNAICPSHYMGVVEMYRTTGDERYLELSKQLIDIRGMVKDGTDHNQDRIPFREQTKAVGHAVRANYLYAGVTDVYMETGEEALKMALDKIWDDLTMTKLYITGGCGALYDGVSPNGTSYQPKEIQQVHQAFGREYELPNAGAHNETCANIGSALWNWRMFQATGEAKYADLMELTLFNSVLSGVDLDGSGYFYTNPLSYTKSLPFKLRWPNVREAYISRSNCCPPNTIRTIAEVGNYLYSKNQDGIWFNLYGSSELNTPLGDQSISLVQTTNYPWEGEVKVVIKSAPDAEKSLNFRVPDWCKAATLYVNGKKVRSSSTSSTHLTLKQRWHTNDEVRFVMEMPVQLIEANPMVEETRNQVAIKRGPLVYCLEANDLADGQNLSDIVIPANIQLSPEKISIANTEVMSLTGKAKLVQHDWGNSLYKEVSSLSTSINIRLIPYFAWANREEADMAVWLPLDR